MLEGTNPFPAELRDRYYKEKIWFGMTLGEMLDRTCDIYFYKEALVAGEVRLTYRELKDLTDRAALAFLRLGIGPRDRVLLQIPNWAEFVYACFGLYKIGAIPVFCIPRYSQREIEQFCEITEARAWIVPLQFEKIDYRPIIREIRASKPNLKYIITIEPPTSATSERPEGALSFHTLLTEVDLNRFPRDLLLARRPDPEEICHLMPTGGTTGLPKIVPRTHNDFLCNCYYRAKAVERGPHDINLIPTPLTHNMAIEVSLNPTFITGGKVVLIPSTRPKEIFEAIQREKVTIAVLAVAQVQQMIDFPERDRYDLSSLKVIATGGSRIPADLIRKIYDQFRCKFMNVFGMSEGPCVNTRYHDPEEVILNTIGWPICPYDEFKVIDGGGNELPRGVEGELVARGPCIFRGYYKSDEENREAFTSEGFFRTGDIAKIDEEGRIILTGRKKDIIIRGGENISAKEVEDLVRSHPNVEEVAAVGMPDPVLGERVCVFIKFRIGTSLTFEELIAYLKEKKTSVLYLPERMEILDEIPLTNVGKVDKKRLREEIKTILKREGKL